MKRQSRSMPAPDLFLYAARQMRTEPQNCLVIEDSIPGVQAGVAAGMTTLGFTGGSHCPANHRDALMQNGATLSFSNMHQLPDILAELAAPTAQT